MSIITAIQSKAKFIDGQDLINNFALSTLLFNLEDADTIIEAEALTCRIIGDGGSKVLIGILATKFATKSFGRFGELRVPDIMVDFFVIASRRSGYLY